MAWTYEEVMAKLGDEAQAVPGAIIVFRNKHIVVAETSTDRGFRVTDEGAALLGEKEEVKAASKPAKKPVKSANVLATEDLDLGV